MKKTLFISMTMIFLLAGCSSQKKRETQVLKEQEISSNLKKEETLDRQNSIGVNEKGNVVQMNKVQMSEYLQTLKYETFKEYEALYGIREYSSKGLAGKLDACNLKISQKKNGGSGQAPKMVERTDVLNTELMNEWKNFNKDKKSNDTNATVELGYNDKGNLTAVTQENLLETVERFQDYRKLLNQKRLEIEQNLMTCESKLDDK